MKSKIFTPIKKYALNTILSVITIFFCAQLLAQPPAPTMDLKIEFDDINDTYDIYFRSDIDINSASMIISQISLAVPSMLTLADLTITSSMTPSASNWFIANNVQEPAADSVYDYLSINNSGGLISAVAGEWQLYFSFALAGGCHTGVRLYDNLLDPQATDPGMNNISFVNSINIIENGTFLSPYRENKPGNSQIIFVDAGASGNNSGNSWIDANPNLTNAINNADCWKTEFWVAEGLYKPTAGTNRNSSFNLRAATSIFGGFLGSESDRSDRLGAPSNTILSGDIGIVDNISDNSHNVVRINNRGLMPIVVDGFRIVDGQANHPTTNSRKRGGGVYINKSNSSIRNCEVEYNSSTLNGGGIYAYRSLVNISEVVSINNLSENNGGGLFVNRCELDLESCNLSNNTALNRGGGMYVNSAFAEMTSIILDENDAFRGGGAYCSNIDGILLQALITDNGASNEGPGLYLDKATSFQVTNCTITDNFILESQAALKITNNISNVNLRNSILWNEGEEIETVSSAFMVSFSNIEGGYIPGTNVSDLLPEFEDVGNYRLQNSSPLLDLGVDVFVPSTLEYDLDGNPRVFGLDIDLGAYENQVGGNNNRKSDVSNKPEINVFPNPFVWQVNLECDINIFHTGLIIDNAGHVLVRRTLTSSNTQFADDQYANGLYHIVLIGDTEKHSSTIVKL